MVLQRTSNRPGRASWKESGGLMLADIALDLIDTVRNVRGPSKPGPYGASPLAGLTESIKVHGVLQPVRVRDCGTRFDLIVGHRRVAAARLAGLVTIPAIVEQGSADEQADALTQLAENVAREDMDPIAVALAIKTLMSSGMTQHGIARSVGKSDPWVSNMLRLLTAERETKDLLQGGRINVAQAKAILSLPRQQQLRLARVAASGAKSAAIETMAAEARLPRREVSRELTGLAASVVMTMVPGENTGRLALRLASGASVKSIRLNPGELRRLAGMLVQLAGAIEHDRRAA